jgi:hypothetical protein
MAREPERNDSVFDFLYIDSRRIALFLSQFGQYGHLKSLTRSVGENSKTGGGIDLKIAKVEYGEGADSSLKKEYDAQWVAPLSFLDQANQRGMIKRGLDGARIGELVLASGSLEIRDLAIIRKMFAMPSMKASMSAQQNIPVPRKSRDDRLGRRGGRDVQQPRQETPPTPADFGLELLAELPHALHAVIGADTRRVWCSLREDSLLVAPSDLFLKHGVHVSGTWNILGILDALPDEDLGEITPENVQLEFQQAQSAMPQGEFGGIMTLVTQGFGGFIDGMAPFVRMLLGRPSRAHGFTPLLIFREVSG